LANDTNDSGPHKLMMSPATFKAVEAALCEARAALERGETVNLSEEQKFLLPLLTKGVNSWHILDNGGGWELWDARWCVEAWPDLGGRWVHVVINQNPATGVWEVMTQEPDGGCSGPVPLHPEGLSHTPGHTAADPGPSGDPWAGVQTVPLDGGWVDPVDPDDLDGSNYNTQYRPRRFAERTPDGYRGRVELRYATAEEERAAEESDRELRERLKKYPNYYDV
jgi:hypothetical protein